MKKTNIYACLFVSVMILFSSCDFNEISNFELPEKEKNIKNDIFEFIYKGKQYSSTYQILDSCIVYDNKNVAETIDSLKKNINLVTFLHDEGSIEFFNDKYDLDQNLIIMPKITRIIFNGVEVISANLKIFEDSKCKGRSVTYIINTNNNFLNSQPDLSNVGLDNKISSIDLICDYTNSGAPLPVDPNAIVPDGFRCIAIFYTDKNFKGNSIAFSVNPCYPHSYIHYLKSYPIVSGSSNNWNDIISSLSFYKM